MSRGNGHVPYRPEEGTPKSWHERWRELVTAYGNIPDAMRLVWAASPGATLFMALLTLVSALLPPAQAWVGKLIVDRVVGFISAQTDPLIGLRLTLPLLALEFFFLLLATISSQARNLAEHILNSKLNNHINVLIIRKALALDLSYFEDADFYDKLQNARREADWRALRIVTQSFSLVQGSITLLSFAALLLRFSPWLAVILFGATIPSFVAQNKYARLTFRLLTWRAPENRQMSYLEHLLTVDNSVKEVKLFGLGEPLLGRYQDFFTKFFEEDEALARRRSAVSVLWGVVATISYYGAYAWIVFRAIARTITLGDMTLYLSVFRQSQSTFQAIFQGLSQLYENSLFMSNLFAFLALEPQMVVSASPRPAPRPIREGIEFRDVSFRYPGHHAWALRHVNLHIRPGEKLALVGANGAGKTTLIKLLTRLYDPTEGQILIDGVDLRDYDLQSWRERIGVIFQDFVRYHFPAKENIGLGQIDAIDDQQRIVEAARKGGADPVLAGLPQGYDTMLGKWFREGYDLSGGEWQKVALSRAFMREAEVLVLDEPTAALDAENEYLVFQRFRELTEGKIAVLISHRFSTVRMADRIAVIQDGAITELGSHGELLELDGTYARLFNIQAAGYR
ncbi:MAG: ABC transporter ATP-binding protein/permease [Ardenticatenaceae bacterium]|nr:ABC transporter ATP-binding protein/permease [Ardenticatenaceae bacterium]